MGNLLLFSFLILSDTTLVIMKRKSLLVIIPSIISLIVTLIVIYFLGTLAKIEMVRTKKSKVVGRSGPLGLFVSKLTTALRDSGSKPGGDKSYWSGDQYNNVQRKKKIARCSELVLFGCARLYFSNLRLADLDKILQFCVRSPIFEWCLARLIIWDKIND